MRAKIKREWPTLVVVVIICLTLMGSCRQTPLPAITLSPVLQPNPTPAQLPKFLSHIYPKPDAVVWGKLSGDHIWVILRLDEIAEPGDTLGVEEMQERVEFLMDSKLLDAEIIPGRKPGAAEVAIAGKFALGLGKHKATVQVRRTSGEVLEYSWTFTVVAAEPTLPDMPEGIQFVRPLPDSTITLQAYREEQLVPPYHAPAFADLRGGVCVGVLTSKIVEPGENLDGDGVSRKYPFVALDGAPPGEYARIEMAYDLGKCIVVDENGVETSYQCPHHYKCWRVALAPGEHEATVQLYKASGEVIEYTWQFTITND